MAIEKAQGSYPPVVDPYFLLLGRLVGREYVGLDGNPTEQVIFANTLLGHFTKNSIGFFKLRQKLLHVVLARRHSREPSAATLGYMERPIKFEHTRYLGDKRTQLVYDVDNWNDPDIINDIVASEVGLCFGPDTEVEARNRGYTLATPGKTRRMRAPRA